MMCHPFGRTIHMAVVLALRNDGDPVCVCVCVVHVRFFRIVYMIHLAMKRSSLTFQLVVGFMLLIAATCLRAGAAADKESLVLTEGGRKQTYLDGEYINKNITIDPEHLKSRVEKIIENDNKSTKREEISSLTSNHRRRNGKNNHRERKLLSSDSGQ